MPTLSEPLPLRFGCCSNVGRKREHNEDSFAALDRSDLKAVCDGLFLVADGMGGMGGGDVASRITVRTVPETMLVLLKEDPDRNPSDLLKQAASAANQAVRAERGSRLALRSMGATLVCALLQGDRLTLANVGDSRAYLFRDGQLKQITNDHSPVWDEVKSGRMTAEEAQKSPFRHQITRAIGLEAQVEPDITTLRIERGDLLLICSDGLTSETPDEAIAEILRRFPEPEVVCDKLVSEALRRGGSDNITVITASWGDTLPPEESTDNTEQQTVVRQAAAPAQSVPLRRSSSVPLLLLAVIALAEAGGLAYLLTRPKPKPLPLAVGTPAPKPLPTDGPLKYEAQAAPLSKTLLRSHFLQVTPKGDILAVTLQNNLVLFGPDGTPLKPPVNNLIASLPPPSKDKKPQALYAMALDASGNRYQIVPSTKSIEKFTAGGVLVLSNIGKGSLHAPTALAAAPSGDLYVIDSRLLRRFKAVSAAAK